MNIFIASLSSNITDYELEELFTPFGEVSSAKVINDRETGRSRGFGFVTMKDEAAATQAIRQLNETVVAGRSIKVVPAIDKADRNGNSSSYDNGYRKNNRGFNNWS